MNRLQYPLSELPYDDFSGIGFAGDNSSYQKQLRSVNFYVMQKEPFHREQYSDHFMNWWQQVEAKETVNYTVKHSFL